MPKVAVYLKKLKLKQILTVFLAGVVLVISTACNSGDARGARPVNPPVQAGGQNNPHKMGGDGYSQYKASPDAKVNDSAFNVQFDSLIAQRTSQSPESREDKMMYKNDTNVDEGQISIVSEGDKTVEEDAPVARDANKGILEKVGDTFKKSSEFVQEGADKAFSGSEK